MNRSDILELDQSHTRRNYALARSEFRATRDGDQLIWDGYASVTEHDYPVYGGPPYGWNETIRRGAFKKTLSEAPDVAFLINHEGLTLARTKSGTLELKEDKVGLRNIARLDARMSVVNDLQIAVERGDIDEQSFAFRVVKDEWFDERGDVSNEMVGTERRITELSLDKGDVSAVNYGANAASSGGFRNMDFALAEIRSGRLTARGRSYIENFAKMLDDRSSQVMPVDAGPHTFEPTPDTGICAVCGQMEANHVDMAPLVEMNAARSLPPELVEQYRALLALQEV